MTRQLSVIFKWKPSRKKVIAVDEILEPLALELASCVEISQLVFYCSYEKMVILIHKDLGYQSTVE